MTGKNSKSVLVVEDDLDLVALIETVLGEEGYRVNTATNGLEALDSVEMEMPGVILLDMRMPVMDGWEFAAKFRESYDSQAPILVLTAAEDARARASEIHADGYLGKPFDLDELIERVATYISQNGRGPVPA
jgi:DNA-binding response OmpR family regulator